VFEELEKQIHIVWNPTFNETLNIVKHTHRYAKIEVVVIDKDLVDEGDLRLLQQLPCLCLYHRHNKVRRLIIANLFERFLSKTTIFLSSFKIPFNKKKWVA